MFVFFNGSKGATSPQSRLQGLLSYWDGEDTRPSMTKGPGDGDVIDHRATKLHCCFMRTEELSMNSDM